MNREIKFRAWDKKQKIMLNNVSTGTVIIWDYTENRRISANSSDCIFMQYTGRKWKDEIKIFTNSILKLNHNGEIGVVEYDNHKTSYVVRYGDTEEMFLWQLDDDEFEIIENKFENPELLKEKE
jgi:uncharacterized phage protein (TIGR01671 family)